LTIDSEQVLNAGSRIWTLSGSGTPFVINGTFNYQTSTFRYTANAPDTPSPANASTSVATSTTLSVDVYDTDGDAMTISFYNAGTSALIGTTSVPTWGSIYTATTTWSGLSFATTYEWYAVANDENFNATSSTWSFTTLNNPSFSCGDTLSYQGKEYDTVLIGTQCWFAENLDYDNGCSSEIYPSTTDIGWCGYYDDAGSDDTYGLLYQWSAAMNGTTTEGAQGICPAGWKVPSHNDWTDLERQICSDIGNSDCDTTFSYNTSYLGYYGNGEASAMAASSTLWTTGPLATSSHFAASGLDVFPAGGWSYEYETYGVRTGYAYFWSSTEFSATSWFRWLDWEDVRVGRSYDYRGNGFSVRCLME